MIYFGPAFYLLCLFKSFLIYRSQLYAFLFSSNVSVKDPGASALQSLPRSGFARFLWVLVSSLLSTRRQLAARAWGLISLRFNFFDKTKCSMEFFYQEAFNFRFCPFLRVAINYFGSWCSVPKTVNIWELQNDDILILSPCFHVLAGVTLLEEALLYQLFGYSDRIHKRIKKMIDSFLSLPSL